MARFAVVKVAYSNDIATGFSVPVVFDGDNAEYLAKDYVRKHLTLPGDEGIANRIEFITCPVREDDPTRIVVPLNRFADVHRRPTVRRIRSTRSSRPPNDEGGV